MTKANGSAFPFAPHGQGKMSDGTWDQNYDPGDSGMTMREWYAGIALHARLSNPKCSSVLSSSDHAKFARYAADFMIKELEDNKCPH